MGFYKITRLANIFTNLFSSKKISKIILFIVLFGVICFLFSGKVFAVEYSVNWSYLDDANINANGNINAVSGRHLPYLYMEDNKIYTFTNNYEEGFTLYLNDNVPNVGDVATPLHYIPAGGTYSVVGNSKYTLTWNYGSEQNFNSNFIVTYRFVDGYMNTIDETVNTLTLQNLWGQIGFAVPLIGVAVLFVIGFIIFRKLSGGSSKGKVKF